MMDNKIAIIGLGYVGLPLAIEFGKVFETIGFDVNELRIKELLTGKDSTLETTPSELKEAQLLNFTSDPEGIQNSNIFIFHLQMNFKLTQPFRDPLNAMLCDFHTQTKVETIIVEGAFMNIIIISCTYTHTHAYVLYCCSMYVRTVRTYCTESVSYTHLTLPTKRIV